MDAATRSATASPRSAAGLAAEAIADSRFPVPFPVGSYAAQLRERLQQFARVQLVGEVWGFRESRVRVYFELRDARGALPCSMWRDDFERLGVTLADGIPRLYVRRLDERIGRLLPGTEGATLPFWSPDGRFVGFFADGAVTRNDQRHGIVGAGVANGPRCFRMPNRLSKLTVGARAAYRDCLQRLPDLPLKCGGLHIQR